MHFEIINLLFQFEMGDQKICETKRLFFSLGIISVTNIASTNMITVIEPHSKKIFVTLI